MSISSAMYAGITGLDANGEALNVVGDNIANLNTTGFKYSRAYFEDLLAQNITTGSGISQIGRGTRLAEVTPIFSQGSLESSDNSMAMAITGSGFFQVADPNAAATYYSRDGNFHIDQNGYLVNSNGYRVQGTQYANGALSGTATNIQVNQNYIAPKTTSITDLVLNLDSTTAAYGSYSSAMAVYDGQGVSHTLNATFKTLSSGIQEVNSVKTGDGTTPAGSYWRISSPTTDYYVWYDTTGTTTPPTPPAPIDPAISTALIKVRINESGSDNANTVATKTAAAINAYTTTDGSSVFTVTGPATGASTLSITNTVGGIATAAAAGTTTWPITDFSVTIAGVAAKANAWQPSFTLDGTAVTGTYTDLQFDSNGVLTSGGTYTLPLTNIGNVTLNMTNTSGGNTTQYASTSATNYSAQNGYPTGALQGLVVDTEGNITGKYSNGQTQDLYQLSLARFTTPGKLAREGNNLYAETDASGTPVTGAAGSNGLGIVNGNSLEQSNVDLGNEFVHMILYQRGFQANSRVITTSDSLLEEVLALKR